MGKKLWLITGGAGYIGSHIADEFLKDGKSILIYDSFYSGLESRIDYLRIKNNAEIPIVKADIRDYVMLESVFLNNEFEGIVHCAALKSVSDSIENPQEYFDVNFEATTVLLEFAKLHQVKKFIFSSSAAVYGNPNSMRPCSELESKIPLSPYGDSKLQAELAVSEYLGIKGNLGASLRFFNVIGTAAPALRDNSEKNLVPILINRLHEGLEISIFGTDYPTPDGTCVRDFVDVRDISKAHLAVTKSIRELPKAMNIGTGRGTSVLNVIDSIETISRKYFKGIMNCPRREGDPASLCAEVKLSKLAMGFEATYTLNQSLRSVMVEPETFVSTKLS